ncbi:MAG: tRNA (guanosine(46)-N7)-methyltransferase TrmB [Bacteroidales bacterium]|nr:tRNA (guanosine(46)-N7)-methyltransferase TrmB [Bacteroidales bacterium]
MVKNKLSRFTDMETFNHVVQPPFNEVYKKNYKLKGKWSKDFFSNSNPVTVELGCGKGEYTVALAKQNPNTNFIGIDIKGARMWRGAKTALEDDIKNVGFLRTRIDFINSFFDNNEVSEIWITFPDPQLKKYYKRLTSTRFLAYYQNVIVENGLINLKTDSAELYIYTKNLVELNNLEIIINTDDLYNSGIVDNILSIKTFYEQQFLAQGKPIHYLRFKLNKAIKLEEPKEEK